jgi:putative membrane protein
LACSLEVEKQKNNLMKKLTLYLALALLISALSFCRDATKRNVETAKESNERKEEMNQEQADFLVEAANSGMKELEMAKLAVDKAQHKRVKSFAKMMVNDHEQLNRDLKELATQKQLTLPAAVAPAQQTEINDLKRKSGTDFDKRFMELMQQEHERDVRKYEDASENHKDSEVQVFAAKTLPKLRAHLDSARMVRNVLK